MDMNVQTDSVMDALLEEKNKLEEELVAYLSMRNRLEVINAAIRALGHKAPPMPLDEVAEKVAAKRLKRTYSPYQLFILQELKLAGCSGLTAREINAKLAVEFPSLAVTTASQALVIMKEKSLIVHDRANHRYYAFGLAP